MKTGYKWALGLGAAFIALKLWSDSARLSQQFKGSPTNTKGTNSVGGVTLTTPSPQDILDANPNMHDGHVTTSMDANPSTSYDNDYFRIN